MSTDWEAWYIAVCKVCGKIRGFDSDAAPPEWKKPDIDVRRMTANAANALGWCDCQKEQP